MYFFLAKLNNGHVILLARSLGYNLTPGIKARQHLESNLMFDMKQHIFVKISFPT